MLSASSAGGSRSKCLLLSVYGLQVSIYGRVGYLIFLNKDNKEVFYIMKVIKIMIHIAVLYVLLLIGEWIQQISGLSVPGSVIGMLLLFFLLQLKIIKLDWIREGTDLILKHLTLFFIPVTIGVINYLELFSGRGILLLLTALVSTGLVIGVSGGLSQHLANRKETQHD